MAAAVGRRWHKQRLRSPVSWNEGDQRHLVATAGTDERIRVVDAVDKACPTGGSSPSSLVLARRLRRLGPCCCCCCCCCSGARAASAVGVVGEEQGSVSSGIGYVVARVPHEVAGDVVCGTGILGWDRLPDMRRETRVSPLEKLRHELLGDGVVFEQALKQALSEQPHQRRGIPLGQRME